MQSKNQLCYQSVCEQTSYKWRDFRVIVLKKNKEPKPSFVFKDVFTSLFIEIV